MTRALLLPGGFLILFIALTIWIHPLFVIGWVAFWADCIGRIRDFRYLNGLSYGQRHRLLHIYAKTACGRQVMIGSHGEGAWWYYYQRGYRIHHIFPDEAFTKNSPFLRLAFWKGLANGHFSGGKS